MNEDDTRSLWITRRISLYLRPILRNEDFELAGYWDIVVVLTETHLEIQEVAFIWRADSLVSEKDGEMSASFSNRTSRKSFFWLDKMERRCGPKTLDGHAGHGPPIL